jgi:hypothetical protein
MGQRLRVVSGYRTAGHQAQLCQRVTGPCAPPGQSIHQLALAVDVTNWQNALPYLASAYASPYLPTTPAIYPTSPAASADLPVQALCDAVLD